VGTVYDKTDCRLHRATRKNLHRTFGRTVALAEQLEELRHRMFPERAVYGDTERPVLAVSYHENDRAAKAGIAHRRGGDQDLPRERGIVRLELKSRRYRADEWRCDEQCPESQDHALQQSQRGSHAVSIDLWHSTRGSNRSKSSAAPALRFGSWRRPQ